MGKQVERLFPILLRRCSRQLDRRIDALLKQHGVARSQYRVLYHVERLKDPTQKELTDALEVQGATLTPIVNTLVQKGWLARQPNEADRRVKRLRLTAAGRELFGRIPDPAQTLHRTIRSQLTAQEAADLTALLTKIVKNL